MRETSGSCFCTNEPNLPPAYAIRRLIIFPAVLPNIPSFHHSSIPFTPPVVSRDPSRAKRSQFGGDGVISGCGARG
jgi:hypothetical protein